MQHPFVQALVSPHDAGVRQVAALSARLAYVLLCLALCWGVFVSTGWVHRLTGRQATRTGHLVLATLALAFGGVHALSLLFLTDVHFDLVRIAVPLAEGGTLGHAAGIVGFELALAIALSVGLQRFLAYRRWVSLHRLGYPALALLAVHSFVGAAANGHLGQLWLGGLTVLVPTAVLAVLRFVPSRVLANAGMLTEDR